LSKIVQKMGLQLRTWFILAELSLSLEERGLVWLLWVLQDVFQGIFFLYVNVAHPITAHYFIVLFPIYFPMLNIVTAVRYVIISLFLSFFYNKR
jgi:hypothetical protein